MVEVGQEAVQEDVSGQETEDELWWKAAQSVTEQAQQAEQEPVGLHMQRQPHPGELKHFETDIQQALLALHRRTSVDEVGLYPPPENCEVEEREAFAQALKQTYFSTPAIKEDCYERYQAHMGFG